MQIKIDKSTYEKLSKNDRLRYIYIKTDPKFEKLILKARKNLGIPPESWIDMENNWYGDGNYKSRKILFTTNKQGDTVPYGDWQTKLKSDRKKAKKINKEVEKFIKNYPIIDGRWNNFLKQLICYDSASYFPNKYSFSVLQDGSVVLNIDKNAFEHKTVKQIKEHQKNERRGYERGSTQSEFIEWVKTNWTYFSIQSKLSSTDIFQSKSYREKDVPDFDNLENVIKIIKLKKLKKKAKDIGIQIDKKELSGQSEKINKAYHRINKQLQKFEKDVKALREKEISIFGK